MPRALSKLPNRNNKQAVAKDVQGAINHYSRIVIQNANAVSNERFMAGTLEIDKNTIDAVNGVMT